MNSIPLLNLPTLAKHLSRKKFVCLAEMCPVGFRDCIFILKKGNVLILPSSYYKKKNKHGTSNFEMDTLEKLYFYHMERCKYEDCLQCIFAINLRFLNVQSEIHVNDSVASLQQYCRLKNYQYYCTRLFIEHLANIEKKG